ncbi:F390 synthetase-related protein [Planktothrix agardhii]|jgi:putative adenylate-forming enzyme|uniref:F390 synthetase-related protein n=1 Tax=Planktothrix agardhii TaxID=1160 RepID=UPI001D09BC9B|nr:F390 synthetase-related protein [Planktothrix agardhii]MCB8786437.1 adenylate cyclase [Planktothrix agardhii 1025]MCF3611920.1 adenylate cyclase [Planktothrix agardhii 1027]MCF3645695.1 adenylate cyclase [Planktothrix agardhii 1026]
MKRILTILHHYLQTKYFRKFKSREQLLTWQNQQVQNFLKVILPQSPFYQQYYQGLDIQDWQNFPIIDKAKMMENFDQLNTVKILASEAFEIAFQAEKTRDFSPNLRGYTVGLSTGTSGNRGLFLVSSQEQWIWAGTILAKLLPNFILFPEKIAFFLRANSQLYETVKSKRLQFKFFDLLEPITNHIQQLNQYQPTILVAPDSLLRLLADAQKQGILNISPKKIVSVAEVLDILDRNYISKVFNQIIHQVYQCTEGFLGYTCEYGTLHLNEDIVAIQKEYLDPDKSRFMPIITDFRRTTQPIIRYRLNDILVERKTPCPCGSVLIAIEQIEGRQDDIFYLPYQSSNGEWVTIFPDFIRRAIVMVSDEIEDYQVMQLSLNRIEVALKVRKGEKDRIQEDVIKSLRALFERLHCHIPEIVFLDQFPSIPKGEKRRRVWQCQKLGF